MGLDAMFIVVLDILYNLHITTALAVTFILQGYNIMFYVQKNAAVLNFLDSTTLFSSTKDCEL